MQIFLWKQMDLLGIFFLTQCSLNNDSIVCINSQSYKDFISRFRVAMDYFVFHGINTDLFQSGVQLNGKTTVSLPWKAGLKKNVKEKNYEVTFPPCKNHTEFFTIKYVFLQGRTVALQNS